MADREQLTSEEKKEIDNINAQIRYRKLEIELKEWKEGFEKLALWIRNNFNETTLFEVLETIKKFRPRRK